MRGGVPVRVAPVCAGATSSGQIPPWPKHSVRRIRAWKRCATLHKMVAKKIAVRAGAVNGTPHVTLGEEGACERVPGPRSHTITASRPRSTPIAGTAKISSTAGRKYVTAIPRGIVESQR